MHRFSYVTLCCALSLVSFQGEAVHTTPKPLKVMPPKLSDHTLQDPMRLNEKPSKKDPRQLIRPNKKTAPLHFQHRKGLIERQHDVYEKARMPQHSHLQ